MVKRWLIFLVSVLLVIPLAGCVSLGSAGPVAEAQPPPAAKRAEANTVIAEGIVTPARSGHLGLTIPGDVARVWVTDGQCVEAGTPLVELDARELELALRSGEQDVLAQEAALQQLLDGASEAVIARADKENRDQVDQAEAALALRQLELQKARAQDPTIDVRAAQSRLDQLRASLAQAQAQDPAPSVTAAEVAVERVSIALDDTQIEYDKALDRPWEDHQIRDGWAKQLKQVKLDYRAAQAQLESAQNEKKAHENGLGVLAAQIEEAKTAVDNALLSQQNYIATLQMLEVELWSAELSLDALKTWDNPYRDPPSEQEIRQARAMVAQAKANVETLKLRLEDAVLDAPFAGMVVAVKVKVGDVVSPGEVVVVLATLDQLEIRTTDLTELDIGAVAEGQAVEVTVDALPGETFDGIVRKIALQSGDRYGDVVYTVTVDLVEQADPRLRWGMTVAVRIDIGGRQ